MTLDDTSVYPYDLDGYATLPLRKDLVHEIRAADHNRLRNAIIKIQQELGIQPSGTFATVAARLDDIGDAKAQILAHLADPEDAHDASAISVLDTADFYFEDNVEDVLAELATLLPPQPDAIGKDNSKVPNDGIPSFVDGYGTKFVYNLTTTDPNIAKKTQPNQSVGVRGLHIIEVSNSTDNGSGAVLEQTVGSPATFRWKAPGDTFGPAEDLSGLSTGETATLLSGTPSKRIRVAKNSVPYGNVPVSETFAVYGFEAVRGYFSYPSAGFKYSPNITRTAVNSTDTSLLQFVIGGQVFPADRGTLVLQRKLRGTSDYFPIAVLDLSSAFNDNLRDTGQIVYTPSHGAFDHFILYDRLPVHSDYSLFESTADDEDPYEDFENTFTRMQVAKYVVPVSVEPTDTVGGELEATSGITDPDVNNTVSAYRIIHYKEGITDFNGNPNNDDVYSLADFDEEDNANTGIQFSNVYVDSSPNRPGIEHITLRPETNDYGGHPQYAPDDDSSNYIRRSGVRYFNSSVNDVFHVEVITDKNVFANTYLLENILTFETTHFNFPSGQTGSRTLESNDDFSSTVIKFGAQVDIEELFDGDAPGDGYLSSNKYSSSNLPAFGDQAFYVVNNSVNTSRKPTPNPSTFSTRAYITGRMYDPFGPGDGYDAYGFDTADRILVNTYSTTRATGDTEWFTDESRRVGTTETFDFNTEQGQFTSAYGSNMDGYTLDAWESNIALVPGMLQCGGRFTNSEANIPGLIFPQDNYRNDGPNRIVPTQPAGASEIDQSTAYNDPSFQIDSTYQRLFSVGHAMGGGTLRIVSGGDNPFSFDDIRYSNTERFAKIEVKIPGNDTNSTGWMDIGKLFQTGKYENGDGALNGAVTGSTGDFTVPFTFGGRNNANAGYMVAVRITYFGNRFEDAKTRILTMVKLEA